MCSISKVAEDGSPASGVGVMGIPLAGRKRRGCVGAGGVVSTYSGCLREVGIEIGQSKSCTDLIQAPHPGWNGGSGIVPH